MNGKPFDFIMLLLQIPEAIVRLVLTYLPNVDHRYFLNATLKLRELKKKVVYYELNQSSSLLYIDNTEGFRSLILMKVENGWKQISIQLRHVNIFPPNFSIEIPVHKINLPITFQYPLHLITHIECIKTTLLPIEIPSLENIAELSTSLKEGFFDYEKLSHLKKLHLLDAIQLTDITALQDIPDLSISNPILLKDFTKLGKQQKRLNIYNGTGLIDVNSFSKIHELILTECDGLIDVSPLKGIYYLNLSFCRQVNDISCLGNHHRLVILSCSENLIGYNSLVNIPYITLGSCDIEDITVLKYAKSIELNNCFQVKDISPIKDVKHILIKYCDNIHNIQELKNVYNLTIFSNQITSKLLSDMKNHKLTINRINHRRSINNNTNDNDNNEEDILTNYSFFHNFKHFTFEPDRTLTPIIHDGNNQLLLFQYLQSITIDRCDDLTSVNGIGNIPTVRIYNCRNLIDITAFGTNHEIDLRSCIRLEDVSSLMTVPIVTIVQCPKIKNYDCLVNVPRLCLSDV